MWWGLGVVEQVWMSVSESVQICMKDTEQQKVYSELEKEREHEQE